ncbi:CHAT domain-containing tetratricopeptide repeat protein [Nostoc sp. ChiVER01]|uniref:CHAT domain-containing protein n=1 Tax=Nostoc sp. ChiVER01 TaxID=3075382 RepID=UPI002AD4DD66|nr:CHAT domain-containing tetratricopeptide repeat protein [Nostoc sp. ChiVER01]MDZ8223586.1 CHAT domain-containing tetratricopeptide repeat protein [Nostoc sp. ChiVER01]
MDKQQIKAYFSFLFKILNTISINWGNSQALNSLLLNNLEKLDDNFAKVLQIWATDELSKVEPSRAKEIALVISDFSIQIQSFPFGSRASNLEIALTGNKMALTVFTREASSQQLYIEQWAVLQTNLANVYCDRIKGNRAENLEAAIEAYQLALKVFTEESFPEEWATIINNLGTAYNERILGNRAENLEVAINAYRLALKVRTREAFPEKWASTQDNLGSAYDQRIKGDRAENLEAAIEAYKLALQVRILEELPQEWAKTHLNLSSTYVARIKGDQAQNLEAAIQACEAALQVYTQQNLPELWAKTQINLAIAYRQQTHENRTYNLQAAMNSYKSALQIFTRDAFPVDWATLQYNLGNLYSDSNQKKHTQNLRAAIQAYDLALQIFTREAFPADWAMTQSSLGTTYTLQGKIDEAIECLQLALEIYTPTSLPQECLRCSRKLGNIAFGIKLWNEAIKGYNNAIDAVEQIRSWATSESRRQEILEESIDLYQNMVQACINAGQIEKAFEYSERSRSKLLVDLMASYNLSQGEEIPPKVQELLQQYEELQRQIDQERQSHKSEKNRSETRAAWEAYNEAIASLETQKQQVWENLRREDPVLAGEIQVNPLSLSEIQKLIDQPNTAILSFYTTNSATHIFVVQQNQITLHTCTGQGLDSLQGWINQNWLLPYINDSKKWETQINSILCELAARLQIPELISQHLQGIEELILVPHLLLHQIPFAALPAGEYQEYLGDKFLIRYTPSCQILEFCQQRNNVETFNGTSLQYGTVEDAEDNLSCARFEGEKLAQMYNIPSENRLIGSSQATCKNYRQLAKKVNVLHSCHHAISRLDNPLESQLKLAHGSITLGQLMTPSWRLPQLVEVFLSCCETNLGIPPLTDDILTLATGFLCAGARSVVSSLWLIDDLATALFSIFYY